MTQQTQREETEVRLDKIPVPGDPPPAISAP